MQGYFLKTWIKFCGTTSLEDALASIEAGADALGFIFADSKRRITVQKARAIIRGLPEGVERIGVFLDGGSEEIARIAREADLTGIQMHGASDSPPEVYDGLPLDRRDMMRKIKTIQVAADFKRKLEANLASADFVDAWLLDTGAGGGKAFDWRAAQAALAQRQGRFIIAGGLSPENVGEAIRIFSPWGVDVVSGIERERGRKDREKMKAFVAAVRKAEQR
jgi:phosphoribosylanthranilate isomerase